MTSEMVVTMPQKINPLLLKKEKYVDPFQYQPNMWEAYIDKLKVIADDIEGIKAWENSEDNPINYGKKIAQRPRKMRNPEKPDASE
jgi:hypothetical protein